MQPLRRLEQIEMMLVKTLKNMGGKILRYNRFKQNLQHESYSPSQSLQLLYTKFSQKKLVSQVMNFVTRVLKTFNLGKIYPNLGRILTNLLGHFSHGSTWSFKLHYKDGL